MKRLTYIGLIILFIACTSDKSNYWDIIGNSFESLDDFSQFKEFKKVGETLTQDGDEFQYIVSRLERDSLILLILAKRNVLGDSKTKYKALDILEINNRDDKNILEIGMCRKGGTVDYKIIGLCDYVDEEILKNVLKAWTVNTRIEKFEEISTDKIDCINIGYGND